MDLRIERIAQRFTPHYGGLDVVVRLFNAKEWAAADLVDPNNNRPFGWLPPHEDGIDVVFPLCPELIVQQTTNFDDCLFEAYVDVIQFCCDLAIAYHEIEDVYERSRMIDKRLLDTAPGSMRLMNKVQMEALDSIAAAR